MRSFSLAGSMMLAVVCVSACGGGSDAKSPTTSSGGSSAQGGGNSSGGTSTSTGGTTSSSGSSAGGGGTLPSSLDCKQAWPAAAPKLEPNKWTAINPSGVKFGGEPGNGAFVQGMAIDPCNPSTIYLGVNSFTPADGAGLYKTVDAGANWTRVGNLDEPVRVRVDPKDPLHLYAGDGVRGNTLGFWVSHDGGNTWAKPAGYMALQPGTFTLDDIYDIATDPADFNHLLVTFHSPWGTATTMQSSGVLESKDGGDSWIVHPPQSTWATGSNVWFLDNSSSWIVGTQADGFWRTTDSGATWKHVSTVTMTHGGGQLYTSSTGDLYTSCSAGVQRSTDHGLTWTTVASIGSTTSVFGDGTTLYTHTAYSGGTAPFSTSLESDGVTWTASGAEMFSDGPFEMAYDAKERIVYSANWGNGLLALKLP